MSKQRDANQKQANQTRTGGADHHVRRSTIDNNEIKAANDYDKGDVNTVSEDMKASREDAIKTNDRQADRQQ